MEFSKKINGERWSLTQDYSGQVTIKKDKEIVSVQNLNYKLDTKAAFNILSKAPNMKMHSIKTKGVEKLNMETKVEETKMEIKEEKIKAIEVPEPHICVFCKSVPELVTLTGEGRECRAISCDCMRRSKNSNEILNVRTRWIYTVDIYGGNVDEADTKLISEWNKRMPAKTK